MKILQMFFLLLFMNTAFAQNPLVKEWDNSFGGTSHDHPISFQQTTDKGFVLAGYSSSGMNGNKTQPSQGLDDFWIVKTDSLGNKQWDRRYGGTNTELPPKIQQTTDNGFIIGGTSYSGQGGDKSQPSWGSSDYWIVKIDSTGVKQWDKRFGGTSADYLYSLEQTNDGGYILGGGSGSNISGDKTQTNWDFNLLSYDFWIIKIDSLGNKEWDKRFGGTDDDWLSTLQKTTDGGYILGGNSKSGIGGDKTETALGFGTYDYWIVKIDSLGIKQWDKRFGGIDEESLSALLQTPDGGYIAGGISYSGISGNKTQPNWDASDSTADYWFVKIDQSGILQWDKRFGGTKNEYRFNNIFATSDGNYLLCGSSYSTISGDKTENTSSGSQQTWVIKTDSLFIKKWDKTIFTNTFSNGLVIQSDQNSYVFALSTSAGIGWYKSQPNFDPTESTADYWLIKFSDTTSTTGIQNNDNYDLPMSVYPNPVNDILYISLRKPSTSNTLISITDMQGRMVGEKNTNHTNDSVIPINVSALSQGVYLLRVNGAVKMFVKM